MKYKVKYKFCRIFFFLSIFLHCIFFFLRISSRTKVHRTIYTRNITYEPKPTKETAEAVKNGGRKENREIVLAIRTPRTKLISRSIGRSSPPSPHHPPACLRSEKRAKEGKKDTSVNKLGARGQSSKGRWPLVVHPAPPPASSSRAFPRGVERAEAGRLHDRPLPSPRPGIIFRPATGTHPSLPPRLYPYARSLHSTLSLSLSLSRSLPAAIAARFQGKSSRTLTAGEGGVCRIRNELNDDSASSPGRGETGEQSHYRRGGWRVEGGMGRARRAAHPSPISISPCRLSAPNLRLSVPLRSNPPRPTFTLFSLADTRSLPPGLTLVSAWFLVPLSSGARWNRARTRRIINREPLSAGRE